MKPRLKKPDEQTIKTRMSSIIKKIPPYFWIGVAFILTILFAFFIHRPEGFSQDSSLYIAVAGPMSGPHKTEGKAMVRGIQLCLDQINDEGGVNGKYVKLLRIDDQDNPDLAKEKALEIIKNKKILVVLGHFSDLPSIEGGKQYHDAGIPSISGSAQKNEVTEGNDWYFRTTVSQRTQATFLAHYIYKILQHRTVNIIATQDQYNPSVITVFEQTFGQLGGEVKETWTFDSTEEHVEDTIENFTKTLSEKFKHEKPPLFLFATDSVSLKYLLISMKRQGVKAPMMTDYSTLMNTDFTECPEEQKHPGYFSDGMYVTTPFTFFDIAGAKAQTFRDAFEGKYFQTPGCIEALYYDAASAAVHAMRMAGVQGDSEEIKEERKRIRDSLASMRNFENAIEGVTGPLYFDKDGSATKPLTVGIFENRKLISALTQLQLANPSLIVDFTWERETGRILVINGNSMYKTHIVYTGIDLHEVSDFDPEDLSYTLDFDLWFRYRGKIDVENIEFLNAIEPIQLTTAAQEIPSSLPLNINEGRLVAEQSSEGVTYRLYRVKGRFKADFLPSLPVFFREHVLGLSFRHRSLTRNNLIYIADALFMEQISERSFWEKLKHTQVLRSVSGWAIEGGEFFQDNFERISLTNPKNLKHQKWTEDYSRFNAGIWIKKDELTLRGMVSVLQHTIPSRLVNYLFLLSCVMVGLLAFAKRIPILSGFSKLVWCLQAIFVPLLLLSTERFFSSLLVKGKISTYYLKLLVLIFDVLWWIVGAFLFYLAIERFIWMPLKKRTERPVPRILRHSVVVILCALTFFGIVAFVFGQRVSSLVATSGVFALILAFSSKIDISNVFAGIGISFSRPFRIGDWVKIGDCEEGQVVDMTSRTTKVQTRDYSMLSIPNTAVASSVIENFNYPDARFRVQFTLETVPIYHPERVQKILIDAVLATNGVLNDPLPTILFKGQGDSSAIYTVIFYINDYGKKFAYKQDVWKRVWIHLERAGIGLATPRREILAVRESQEDMTHPLVMLRNVELFEPLPDDAKTALSQCMRRHHYPIGETIVRQGASENKSLFIIIEGAVGLWVPSEDGTPIEVTRIGTGDVFGEMELLTGKARRFGAISLTETELYEIMKQDIAPFIQKHPELAERFSKKLTERQLEIETQKDLHEAQQTDKESQILEKIQQFFGLKKDENQTP